MLVTIETHTQELAAQAQKFGVLARVFQCGSDDDATWATDYVRVLRTQLREIEEQERTVTQPLRTALDRVRAWFREPVDALTAGIRHISDEIARYQNARRVEQVRALHAATSINQIRDAVALTPAAIEGQHVRRYYSARVVDPSQVPREFWILDQKALDAKARAEKSAFAVPGVELIERLGGVVR